MAPPKKRYVEAAAGGDNGDDGDPAMGKRIVPPSAPKKAKKPRAKSNLEMPGFPRAAFDVIPAVAKKSNIPQAVITQTLKRAYVDAATAAVESVKLTAQDIAREHLAELQAALDE